MIKVQIVADSINNFSDRLTSLVLTYPRIIHSEMMTHRMFSRNASSSRAVPVDKMIKAVRENTFCPFEFQKSHKGMQGSEYFTGAERKECVNLWLESAELALQQAEKMKAKGISKQIINRILEPYQYYTALVTATEWENFFSLRCPIYVWEEPSGNPHVYRSKKDALRDIQGRGYDISELLKQTDVDWQKMNTSQAEIHIQALAESMWDAMNESTPRQLEAGMWHYPFHENMPFKVSWEDAIKISVARCARLSYMTFDGEIDYEKDIRLHDQLLKDKHYSPFEHCARAMDEDEYSTFFKGQVACYYDNLLNKEILEYAPKETYGWCNNFRGWIQYRYLIENKQ